MSVVPKGTSDAVALLHRRYVRDDPNRKAMLEAERVNVEVAQMIYDRRTASGLSQRALAELIGTTQSVISRLENADYDGHSLSMLNRIASALECTLTVTMTPHDPGEGGLTTSRRHIPPKPTAPSLAVA
jgi:ribosome-binding protein aMBF1 (putative translation factor)